MGLRIVQVDAFTNTPFAGNPAAVCVLSASPPEEWMQHVAREMNLSETAFLTPCAGGAKSHAGGAESHAGGAESHARSADSAAASYNLRWFTPSVEVDLCGHATVAAAHVLWEEGHLPASVEPRFHTRSGILSANKRGEWIELDFPATAAEPAEAPAGLLEALGAEARFVGKNKFDYLVDVASEKLLRTLSPDFTMLRKLPVRGVIVTARSETPEFDFVSRFFAPGAGIDEDPVTGSAHCALGPYWAEQLGKPHFTAYQASPRGGVVRVTVNGNRVILGGQAVTVLRGELAAEP